MAHLQYMPGDPRLVDQLVCELKSKGIFDQFRKECISDVDTRPAYQNLRQRVESSVALFLSRQVWRPELNKNQLRDKLRKHLLDGNYLEQGVERIVDQVVNPKVASVFIPQVEDLVYDYFGIPRRKAPGPSSTSGAETSNGREDLLPTDLEAVSPGSVKSNDEKDMDISDPKEDKMDIDEVSQDGEDKVTKEETTLSGVSELTIHDSDTSIDKSTIPLPAEEINLETIPAPENSPPNIKTKSIDLEKIDLPKEPNLSTDIPLPDELPKAESGTYFKPLSLLSEDDDSSSDSTLIRNMSPLTPIRNFNNENSCDAQQAFENDSDGKDSKNEDTKEPSSFRFTIESKSNEDNSLEEPKIEILDKKPEPVATASSYQFNTPNIQFNTPLYDDSSNSNNLQIDYESDVNSKTADTKIPEPDLNSEDSSKKEKKDERKSSHRSSHKSRDSHRHSSSKDKRSESKQSSSRDSSRHEKKSSSSKDDKTSGKDDKSSSRDDKSKSSHKEKSSDDRSDKKGSSRDSSKHRSSSSYKSSRDKDKDSKHRSSSSSTSKHSSRDDKKSSTSSTSSSKDKDKSSSSKDKYKDSKSSSRDKDRKSSSSSKRDEKENRDKKDKKDIDDHYSLSGRGNNNRRSTDRDSNDGSSSSKGSHNPSLSKAAESKKENKSSKSSNTSSSGDNSSPSDGIEAKQVANMSQSRPVVRVDTALETPVSAPPRLPFVPDITMKKPRFAVNMQEAKELMKMRKFMEEEQKRMNQEAALLLEFQANVRPSLSQVYSSISGPELEFACVSNNAHPTQSQAVILDKTAAISVDEIDRKLEALDKSPCKIEVEEKFDDKNDEIAKTLIAMHEDDADVTIKEAIVEPKIEHTNESVLEALTDQTVSKDDEKVEIVLTDDSVEVILEDIKVDENEVDIKDEDEKDTKNIDAVIVEEIVDNVEAILELKDNIQASENPEDFRYFAEHEKFNAELERDRFSKFLKNYSENITSKMYLINCDPYEENLIREAAESFGQYEIVNYFKNGHLKLAKPKHVVKHDITKEINLPLEQDDTPEIFSPIKSDSFELSSDYSAKLEEMVNKTSRQQIMEIILGSVIDEEPSEMPQIDYCMDSSNDETNLKRKMSVDSAENNNRIVLTPNKIRKLSGSDQITSTTTETEETPSAKVAQNITRSKYLGKARRVGLSKPKKCTLPNSPSSDKSVENYEQTNTPNGRIKTAPRSKVQRYDTSDLYKPKLHYLSRRNNIS